MGFYHNIIHSAAMIVNSEYCAVKLTQNKGVMVDLFALIDRWGPGQQWDKVTIKADLLHFRQWKDLC